MSDDCRITEMLGYQRDTRLLIINADDFDMCHAQNEGTIRSIDAGMATFCSLMPTTPWHLHAAHFLREHPELSFSIHLTALSEYVHYRWAPLLPAQQIPSLVDEEKFFYADDRMIHLVQSAKIDELEAEFRAQIEKVLMFGLKPTHLDSHYFINKSRPDIFDLTFGLAREYGLALRVNEKEYVDKVQAHRLPTTEHGVLDSGRIAPQQKGSVLADQLRNLPYGLSEWALHPGIATEELKAVTSNPRVPGVTATPEGRQTDFDFITSKEAAELIDEQNITLISYKPLQELWQSKQ